MNAINFTTVEQIEQAPTKDLIEFYNSLNKDKPVKKFTDRQTALKRCIALLDSTTSESLAEKVNKDLEEAQETLTKKVKKDIEEVAGDLTKKVGKDLGDALTEKVRKDLEGAHKEFEEEGGVALEDPDREPEAHEKKHHWPFHVPNSKAFSETKEEEKQIKRSNVGHASNSAGVAASWANQSVADARLTRDGVSVTVNGKTTEHKSTRDAFRHYRLLDSKHIRFRGELKAAREATYTENGVDYKFKIVSLVKVEKKSAN